MAGKTVQMRKAELRTAFTHHRRAMVRGGKTGIHGMRHDDRLHGDRMHDDGMPAPQRYDSPELDVPGIADIVFGHCHGPHPCIAAFEPMATEPDIVPLMRELAARGATVIVPDMRMYPDTTESLRTPSGRQLATGWKQWRDPLHAPALYGATPCGSGTQTAAMPNAAAEDGDGERPHDGEPRNGGSSRTSRDGDSAIAPIITHDSDVIAKASVILAPALAVDRQGHRLGHGAGWYDRALAHRSPDATVFCVVWAHEFVEFLPTEEHDIAMDFAMPCTTSGTASVIGLSPSTR